MRGVKKFTKPLEFYIKTLSQPHEGVSKALIGKIGLGIHNLGKALQKLRDLNEAQKVKRKYGVLSAVLSLSIIIIIVAFPSIALMLQSITIHGIPISLPILATLISLFLSIIDNLFENRASKWLLEVLKSVLRALTSHS